MKSFPMVKRQKALDCFNRLTVLYENDLTKILDAAELASATDQKPFIKSAGDIASQIATIGHKVERIADNTGRDFLINLIEKLHENLTARGAALGVTIEGFCTSASMLLENDTQIKFLENGSWNLEWLVSSQQEEQIIVLPLRKVKITANDIIPNYIIQYVDQALIAYRRENYLTSLSLISIALEGTLRDALQTKGYSYTHGAQTVDSYELQNAVISSNINGFEVQFEEPMPRHHNQFLSEIEQTPPHVIKIKRIQKYGRWFLEIRDIDYLKEFWSSNVISQAGQINIGGLGTALQVARDTAQANILSNIILPDDIDEVVQQVRNNLIHLSGVAMTTTIPAAGMSLEDFANNKDRVFDTVWSICGAIEKLYSKIAEGTI